MLMKNQLPWLSVPDATFPSKTLRKRRKRKSLQPSSDDVQLPTRYQPDPADQGVEVENMVAEDIPSTPTVLMEISSTTEETPTSSLSSSDVATRNITIPLHAAPESLTPDSSLNKTRKRSVTKPIVPVLPIKPIVATPSNSSSSQPKPSLPSPIADQLTAIDLPTDVSNTSEKVTTSDLAPEGEVLSSSPPIKQPPKSWAELLRNKALAVSGAGAAPTILPTMIPNGVVAPKTGTLADALKSYSVDNDVKLCFLEPRGLINTGNMCYMNSVSCIC